MPNSPRFRAALFALAATLTGCGTGVVSHRFVITVVDPGGRLGPPPIELSLFDPQMGRSEEWARRTRGVAAPGTPFRARYDSVETKMLFDAAPPRRITAAMWLPAYAPAGFFAVDLEPHAGAETTVSLPFVPWADVDREGATLPALPVRVRAEDDGDGAWTLHLTLEIP